MAPLFWVPVQAQILFYAYLGLLVPASLLAGRWLQKSDVKSRQPFIFCVVILPSVLIVLMIALPALLRKEFPSLEGALFVALSIPVLAGYLLSGAVWLMSKREGREKSDDL